MRILPGRAFTSNVRSSFTAAGGAGGPIIGPSNTAGCAITRNIDGRSDCAAAGSTMMRPLAVDGLLPTSRMPLTSSPLMLTSADADSVSPPPPIVCSR